MALPESYTELSLAQYMHAALGSTATALGLTAPTDDPGVYAEAVNDALILYGVRSILDATDIEMLRSAARLAVWRMVAAHTAGNYDLEVDDESFDRSQMHDHALAMVKSERAAAMRHGIEYNVAILPVKHIHDPYDVLDDDERVAV